MRKLILGILLVLMMFGHNFVLNQTQTMQKALEQIHSIGVTEFNLLYSIPSVISILFIIPVGFFYEKYLSILLLVAAVTLSLGQLLVTLFSAEHQKYYYSLMMSGRVFEGIGAEILYMIQGNMVSSWMGKWAGLVFILPEFGEIINVVVTPWTYRNWGVQKSFLLGFIVCLISTIACFAIYYGLKRRKTMHYQQIKLNESQTSQQGQEGGNFVKEESSIQLNPLPQKQQMAIKPTSILKAGKIFWLVIFLCAINQCLYFPFLDNANELIINRFCIPFEDTGYYLSIPFIAAMITSAISSYFVTRYKRNQLIVWASIIPLLGHSIIFFDQNCDSQGPTVFGKTVLVLGFCFFGMGIGSYYSISFPAVGLSVPQQIRGMGYACMGFFQTISMTTIPIVSGLIIESQQNITKLSEGYKQSSLLFVSICVSGVILSLVIDFYSRDDSFQYDDEENLEFEDKEEKEALAVS